VDVRGRSRGLPGRRGGHAARTGVRTTPAAVALRALLPCSAAGYAVPLAWLQAATKQWSGPARWLPPAVCRMVPDDRGAQCDTLPRLRQNDWCKSDRRPDCIRQYAAGKMTCLNPG